MSPSQKKPPRIEYAAAKELAPSLGRKPAWLYYHAKSADGPIRSIWGQTKRKDGSDQGVKLFHVQDATRFSRGYEVGQNRGKLYPGSILQERIGTPDELRAITSHGLTGFIRNLVHEAIEKKVSRSQFRMVAGGRK